MTKKCKRWAGPLYKVKQDYKITRNNSDYYSYEGKKGQILYENEVHNIRRLISLNFNQDKNKIDQYYDSIIEEIDNFYFQADMEVKGYYKTNSGHRIRVKDFKTKEEHHISMSDFFDVIKYVERGGLSGLFTYKKHGTVISIRMIHTDEELEHINNGTW